MKPTWLRISFAVSVVLAVLINGNIWAQTGWTSTCQSTGGPSGTTLIACNYYAYDLPTFGLFSEYASSQIGGPYQPQINMYADARPQDRCKNADGSWQSWLQLGYKNKAAYGSYIQTDVASGYYQGCNYGHQYRSQSYHSWWSSGYSKSLWVDKII